MGDLKGLRQALAEQYHAGLAMLAECIETCPDDVWRSGTAPREFWQIAWHAAYFTHNYLVQDEAAFNNSAAGWPQKVRTTLGISETQRAVDVEPYELPTDAKSLTQKELLEYVAHLRSVVDETVDGLDLETGDSGFSWYPNINKLSHQLMNLRHLQGHVGQLSELLMQHGIDTSWIARADGT